MSIASLGKMVSGLVASQRGLQVTGHNLANLNTAGYSRQQLLQHESSYVTVGSNGGNLFQIGNGVSVTEIRQSRDEFADRRYRTENSVLSFYSTKNSAVSEVEGILDEPYGATLSGLMNDFWEQAQKLSTNPSGVEERLAFIQTADVLAKRMNDIAEGYSDYQYHLNEQVKDSVGHVNDLLHGIKDLNEIITVSELSGDNANDYRDQRNMLLDELSGYIDIKYHENTDGSISISSSGRTILDDTYIVEMSYKTLPNQTGFVDPIWSDTGDSVFNMNRPVNSSQGNDAGQIQALLSIRGQVIGSGDTSWDEIAISDSFSVDVEGNAYMIPRLQKELAMLSEEIANIVNDALGGYGIDGEKGIPVFVPIKEGQAMGAGNIKVNDLLFEDGGYNHLGTASDPSNIGDNSLIVDLLDEWNKPREWPAGKDADLQSAPHKKVTDITNYYVEYVADIGTEGYNSEAKIQEKLSIVQSTNAERQSMSAVSQDEELSNMLKYQYAYNAASRMITVMDGMMDTVINRM